MKLIFLIVFSSFSLFAQNKFDSLDLEIQKVKGKKRIDLLNEAAYGLSADSTEKSLIYSKYAIEAAQEIQYVHGEALACLNAANVYKSINKFSDAIDYYKAAYQLYTSLNSQLEAAFSLKSIAEIYTRLADFDKALDYALQAINIYQSLGHEIEISETLSVIGQIYYATGNFDKALEYFSTSYDIAKSLGDDKKIINGLSWLALIYDEQKNEHEKALEVYNEALMIADSANLSESKAEVLKNLGKLYFRQNNFDKAAESFELSLKIFEELKNIKGIAEVLHAMSEINIAAKEYGSAETKLDAALQHALKGSLKLLIVENNFLRSKLYKAQGNYGDALKFYSLYTEMKDSLFSLEKSRQLADIQTIHETEKKEKLIEIQALKLAEQQKEINLYLTIAVIIAFGSLIIYILYRNYKHIARFLRTVINSLTHPFYVIRTDDLAVELANTKAASSSLVSNRKFAGIKTEFEIPKDGGESNWLLEKVVESKSPFTAEQKVVNEKGENSYYEIQGYPIFDKKGNVVKMIEYSIDVTSRKTAEEALRESEQKLRELNATKDKFFSIIAHDLKNPFSVILGYSEMLYEDFAQIPEKEKIKYVSLIGDTAQHSYNLLEDLLNWARSQTGILEVNKEKIDINFIAKDTINFSAAAAESKKIILNSVVPENLIVDTDRFMLSTILRNLVNNAIKFTDNEGGVTIKALHENNQILFSITDTGIGLKPEDIEKLFRIDVNINTIGSPKNKGTGLGLILCREFVEKLGGKIWAEGEIGKGSCFKFTIPI